MFDLAKWPCKPEFTEDGLTSTVQPASSGANDSLKQAPSSRWKCANLIGHLVRAKPISQLSFLTCRVASGGVDIKTYIPLCSGILKQNVPRKNIKISNFHIPPKIYLKNNKHTRFLFDLFYFVCVYLILP